MAPQNPSELHTASHYEASFIKRYCFIFTVFKLFDIMDDESALKLS